MFIITFLCKKYETFYIIMNSYYFINIYIYINVLFTEWESQKKILISLNAVQFVFKIKDINVKKCCNPIKHKIPNAKMNYFNL